MWSSPFFGFYKIGTRNYYTEWALKTTKTDLFETKQNARERFSTPAGRSIQLSYL
jgi:hypothetical protein